MFTTTIQMLKNTIKVSKHTGKEETFKAKRKDQHRDILIEVTYCPIKDTKQDIYPYWKIFMVEEEVYRTVFINSDKLHEVRDIFNGFMAQGIGESYLNAEIIPY